MAKVKTKELKIEKEPTKVIIVGGVRYNMNELDSLPDETKNSLKRKGYI